MMSVIIVTKVTIQLLRRELFALVTSRFVSLIAKMTPIVIATDIIAF